MGHALTARLLLLAALLPATVAHVLAQEREIIIGTTGAQLNGSDPRNYTVFSDYLAQAMPGYRFAVRDFDTIGALMEAVDLQALDFAMLTPAAYVELAQSHEVRPLATVTQEVDGHVYPWLASAVFTLDDADAPATLADVEGRSVIALARLAVGGWLAAQREWHDLGIDADTGFASLEFLFSFEQLLQRVCSGDVEIGVMSAQVLHRMRSECAQPLRVLRHPQRTPDARYPVEHSTRLYPELAFVALGTRNDEDLVVAMTKALLSVEPGSSPALAASVAGFTAPLSYEPIQSLMQELRIGPFAGYGQLTFAEFLRQHSGKVTAVLLMVMGLLGLGFIRSQHLNRELKQAEQFRRLLFEKSALPVVVFNRANLSFVDMNQAAATMFGFHSPAEGIGKSTLDMSAPVQKNGRPSKDCISELSVAHAYVETNVSFTWMCQRPDGSIWEAEIHVLPVNFGKQRLLQATMEDVTERNRIAEERERLSQQLHHAQRLESLGRLSGAIAHDFNNLLTVINGYSELLLLSMDKQSQDYRTLLEIVQAGWRARDLTNQLLTFGRRQTASVRPLDVNALILDAGNMFRGLLGERIRLQTTLDTDPGLVLADPGQLGQVLMNLVANARDAMPEGGTCYLSTMKVDVGAEEAVGLGMAAGPCMLVSVTDTGSGMSPEVQAHVFEPFFSTKGDKGNGIGLATAYGIVRQSGGSISFVSQSGQGTSFSIHLPITDRQQVVDTAEVAGQADLQAAAPFRILVVEDQPDVRLYAGSVLKSAGYEVLDADSGEQALALARGDLRPFDLLFTDVVMPGMNGRELAEAFAQQWPDTRILFTSGYADDEVALHGVVQERILFIAKPYVPQHLLGLVKTILGRQG